MEAMTHTDAVNEMATERYLLDELTPELREAFEEHMFDCQECAMDVRAGSMFLTEATAQLPQIVASEAPERAPAKPEYKKSEDRKPWWTFWTRPAFAPAFAAPVFAALLAVIAYQNFETIPGLRTAASEPRLLPWASLRAGTRGVEPTTVRADRKLGAVVVIDLPQQPAYASYGFDLNDPQGKRVWSQTRAASSASSADGETVSLLIPGAGLMEGSYTLSITGISPEGARTQIGHRVLDVHFIE